MSQVYTESDFEDNEAAPFRSVDDGGEYTVPDSKYYDSYSEDNDSDSADYEAAFWSVGGEYISPHECHTCHGMPQTNYFLDDGEPGFVETNPWTLHGPEALDLGDAVGLQGAGQHDVNRAACQVTGGTKHAAAPNLVVIHGVGHVGRKHIDPWVSLNLQVGDDGFVTCYMTIICHMTKRQVDLEQKSFVSLHMDWGWPWDLHGYTYPKAHVKAVILEYYNRLLPGVKKAEFAEKVLESGLQGKQLLKLASTYKHFQQDDYEHKVESIARAVRCNCTFFCQLPSYLKT
jgi:hypothetical protein